MPTKGSETKAARIRKDDLEVLKMQLKGITFSEWVHRKINTNGNVDSRVYEDIKMTALLSGVTPETFLSDICRAINNGEIVYEKRKFSAKSE